ncbi:hypothetical protein QCA50_002414 [Cerrena zonata]|uniref:Uncharacterized protein n=1 Tax=Cerrena zonata TaxID=2478898 RepID=A0AAW0GVH7_9APHY
MATTIAQHPPAMKVGGRRLSVNSRPKPAVGAGQKSPTPPSQEQEPTDYPRPVAPGDQQVHDPQHPHDDHEEVPKKDKKRGHGALDHERRLQESLHRKAEQNRPTRDLANAKNDRGGKIIGQPAGKAIVV